MTFHRAFDEITDQIEAIHTLQNYKSITRILTSGGQKKVIEAVDQIKQLVSHTKDTHLRILAGSGLNLQNITEFVAETGVQEVHLGTGVRLNEHVLEGIEPVKMRELRNILG